MVHFWPFPAPKNPSIQCSQGTAGCTALESNSLVSLPSPPSSLKRRPRGSAGRRGTQRRITDHWGMARLFSSAHDVSVTLLFVDKNEFFKSRFKRTTPKRAICFVTKIMIFRNVQRFKWRKLKESRGSWKDGSDMIRWDVSSSWNQIGCFNNIYIYVYTPFTSSKYDQLIAWIIRWC